MAITNPPAPPAPSAPDPAAAPATSSPEVHAAQAAPQPEAGSPRTPAAAPAQAAVGIRIDGEPVARVDLAGAGDTLADVRRLLTTRQLIGGGVVFVDAKGFRVDADDEKRTRWNDLLADGRTLRLKNAHPLGAQAAAARRDLLADTPPDAKTAATLPTIKPVDTAAMAAAVEAKTAAAAKLRTDGLEIVPGAIVRGADDLVTDPLALNEEAWKRLLARNNLFAGLRLDTEVPEPSPRAALVLRMPLPRFMVHDDSEVIASVTSSERQHTAVAARIDKAEAHAGYAFVSARVEATHKREQQQSSATRTVHATGAWNLPRVTVHLPPRDVAAAEGFRREIAAIVGDATAAPDDATAEESFYRLQKLFAEYGHVWATEVTLGGQLALRSNLEVASQRSETAIESDVRAAVAVKVGAFAAGAGYGTVNTARASDSEVKGLQERRFEAVGGDTRLAQDPASWVPTVGPVVNWRVIGRRGLLPLYRLLEPELQTRVRALLERFDERHHEAAFGDWSAVEPFTQQRAERDGFIVFASAGARADAVPVELVQERRDGRFFAVPGALPPYLPAAPTDPKAGWLQSLLVPVRRGDHYVLRAKSIDPSRPTALRGSFLAFADLDAPAFANSESPEELSGWTAPADGFVTLATPLGEGDGETVLTLSERAHPDDAPAVLASARGVRGSIVTLCVPVRQGFIYDLDGYAMTTGGERFSALRYWALNAQVLRFGSPLRTRRRDEWYRADTDGCLLVQALDSTRGSGLIRVETAPPDEPPVGSIGTTFDGYQTTRRGCLTAVLRQHERYRVLLPDYERDRITFYPLIRP